MRPKMFPCGILQVINMSMPVIKLILTSCFLCTKYLLKQFRLYSYYIMHFLYLNLVSNQHGF